MAEPDNRPDAAGTRIWFDTEFIEDGSTVDLLSIGMVRSDGATYYAEPAEADRSRADTWVQANVLPHLVGPVKPRAQIAREVIEFVGEEPEFWAYYADYDWVALCQLYGRMIDLPKGWPMFCRDIKQMAVERGNPKLPVQSGTEHHALADAQWNREAWDFLSALSPYLAASADVRRAALEEAVQAAWLERQGRQGNPAAFELGAVAASVNIEEAIRALAGSPSSPPQRSAPTCVACEDNPRPPNDPCTVCGRSSTPQPPAVATRDTDDPVALREHRLPDGREPAYEVRELLEQALKKMALVENGANFGTAVQQSCDERLTASKHEIRRLTAERDRLAEALRAARERIANSRDPRPTKSILDKIDAALAQPEPGKEWR